MFARALRRAASVAVSTAALSTAAACRNEPARDETDPVIVVGGGVMGRAAAWRLALSGQRVVLLDALNPLRGSWGDTRASHLAMEDKVLLKMSLASMPEWIALEEEFMAASASALTASARRFYFSTGRLFAGPVGSTAPISRAVEEVAGSVVEVESLCAAEVNQRWPQLSLRVGVDEAIYMAAGYVMHVDTALEALGWAARRAGALIVEDEEVTSVDLNSRVLRTASGREMRFRTLVLTTGPWTNQMLQRCGLPMVPMVVSNEQTLEFAARRGVPAGAYAHTSMPLFSWSEAGYKGQVRAVWLFPCQR